MCVSLSLFFSNGLSFEKPGTESITGMESRGIDANFSFSNRFVPHSRTRTSGKHGSKGWTGEERGGWLCVEPPFRIWRYRIMKDNGVRDSRRNGRQLINSSSRGVCYAEFSRPAPRFASIRDRDYADDYLED